MGLNTSLYPTPYPDKRVATEGNHFGDTSGVIQIFSKRLISLSTFVLIIL